MILLRDREEPVGGLSSQIIAAAREGDLPRFLRLAEKYGSLERAQSLVRSSGLPVTRITRGRVYITDGGDPEDGEGEPDG